MRCMKAPLFSAPEPELRSALPLPLLLVRPPGSRHGVWLRVKDALTDTFSNCPPGTEASPHLLRGHLAHWEHAVQKQKVRGVAAEPGEPSAERGSDLLPSLREGKRLWKPRGLALPKLSSCLGMAAGGRWVV